MGWSPKTVFEFFPQKPHTGWMKAEKPVLGHIFPYIGGSIGAIVSKNNRVHPYVDSHQPFEFHENRFKTAILWICDQGPPKRKTWPLPPPHSALSEFEGVRIMVISFRNIAKNFNSSHYFVIILPSTFSNIFSNFSIIFPKFRQTFPKTFPKFPSDFFQLFFNIYSVFFSKLCTANFSSISSYISEIIRLILNFKLTLFLFMTNPITIKSF